MSLYAFAVMVDHISQRLKRAVMHIRGSEANLTKAWRLKLTMILRPTGDRAKAKIFVGPSAISQPDVRSAVDKEEGGWASRPGLWLHILRRR